MKNLRPRTKLARLLVVGLTITWFALSSMAWAVDPPPDGGYPNANTAEGEDALFSLASFGIENTALGYHALYYQTSASGNTAVGANALAYNVSGFNNTAIGDNALSASVGTSNNTAVGYAALSSENSYAHFNNVAVGYRAMALADSMSCVAIGAEALLLNTGQLNTAVGEESMTVNTTGEQNAALGWRSLFNNVTGNNNTVSGLQAMFFNESGSGNVALGFFALGNNTTGNNNIALGIGAGRNLTTGSNNIAIGNGGVAGDFDVIRIGAAHHHATIIAGIVNTTLAAGVPVIINREGRLGVATSSGRYKDAIKPMDKESEAILALQPVTFHYKHELDPDGIPQFGLVAEQVEKVDPDLVARDEQGEPYTVRFEAVNAMLLNEFLKEHRRVETQEATIADIQSAAGKQATTITDLKSTVAQQRREIQALVASLKEQAAQIQKVSEQLRAQALASRVVANN